MASKDAISTVLNRNSFYRDGYRLLLRISLVQAAVIICLVMAIVALVSTMKPRQTYFATTSDGRIISVVPLNDPYLSPAQLVTWAAGTAQNVMTFGYHDWRDKLQQAGANFFTPTGRASFEKALKDSNFLDAVQAHKEVVMLTVNAAPEIQSAFDNKGVYTWYLQFPVTIKFDGDQPLQPINAILKMQIVRVSTLQNPDGVSIEQWILKTDTPRQ